MKLFLVSDVLKVCVSVGFSDWVSPDADTGVSPDADPNEVLAKCRPHVTSKQADYDSYIIPLKAAGDVYICTESSRPAEYKRKTGFWESHGHK